MKRTHLSLLQLACFVLCGFGLSCCGRPSTAAKSSHSVTISNPDNAWGKDIKYENGSDGCSLSIDGVRFELLDLNSAAVDFEALGIKGISVTGGAKISYKSTEQTEDAFMAVLDKPVAIRQDVLYWGGDSLGPVSDGDVFIADAQGLRPKP
jgi:hypothetical protein